MKIFFHLTNTHGWVKRDILSSKVLQEAELDLVGVDNFEDSDLSIVDLSIETLDAAYNIVGSVGIKKPTYVFVPGELGSAQKSFIERVKSPFLKVYIRKKYKKKSFLEDLTSFIKENSQKERLDIRLPLSVKRKLASRARRRGITQVALVKELIEDFWKRNH